MPVSLVLDFRTADLRTRERFHLGDDGAAHLYAQPRPGAELVVLSTCNRVEVYGTSACRAEPARIANELARMWTAGRPRDTRDLLRAASVRSGPDAARHLLRVASGLESQVLGDAQVLGQVRRAYRAASETGSAGPILHRLFETALRTGKRVAAETSLAAARNSVGTEAAVLAARRLGSLAGKRCVLVGCGKTGEQAARRLLKLGGFRGELGGIRSERSESRDLHFALRFHAETRTTARERGGLRRSRSTHRLTRHIHPRPPTNVVDPAARSLRHTEQIRPCPGSSG